MLALISPAKVQNFAPLKQPTEHTQPIFLKEAEMLARQLRSYSISQLAELMQINPKLAEENVSRYMQWTTPFTPDNAKPAVFTYNGEVYRGLNAASLAPEEMEYLQNHLRIMSGLYGLLRPLDLIRPYRLEVKTKFRTETDEDLYAFWKQRVTQAIAEALKTSDNPDVVINLTSAEYTKMIDKRRLKARIIGFDFLQYAPDTDTYKSIVVYLKKARGMMVRHIARHRITRLEELKAFAEEGYWYNEQLSTDDKMVFVR